MHLGGGNEGRSNSRWTEIEKKHDQDEFRDQKHRYVFITSVDDVFEGLPPPFL